MVNASMRSLLLLIILFVLLSLVGKTNDKLYARLDSEISLCEPPSLSLNIINLVKWKTTQLKYMQIL